MKLALHRLSVPYHCTSPPVSKDETIGPSAVPASERTGNSNAVHSIGSRGGDTLNLTSNVFLLIALFVIVLVLPACDTRPAGNRPNVFDDGDEDEDETLLV